MGVTLAEILVLVVAIGALYRLLAPLRRRFEDRILKNIDPKRRNVIDVRAEDHKSHKS